MREPVAPHGFTDSMARLRSVQKSNKGAPLYSVLVNRPMGRVFAALAHQVGITPNAVTGISAGFTIAGIVTTALCPPTVLTGILVALCLVLGYGLDAADGQLSRLRGTSSMLGEWLDHVADSFKIATLHLAVLVTAFTHWGSRGWLWVPLGFSAVYVVHFFGMLLTELLARVYRAGHGGVAPVKGGGSMWVSLAKLPTDYGFLALVFVTLGLRPVFQWLYTIMFVCTAAYTALVLPKWARSIAALDEQGRVAAAQAAPQHTGAER